MDYLWRKWEPVCGNLEDLQLFRSWTADLRSSLRTNIAIEREIPHFPFLQSREAFVQVLQSACDDTALWLQETFPKACEPIKENNEDTNTNTNTNTHTNTNNLNVPAGAVNIAPPAKIFQPFKHIPQPRPMRITHLRLVEEYEILVEEWNVSVARLFTWFPFPIPDELPASCGARSAATAGVGCEGKTVVATDSVHVTTVESVQV